VNDLNISVGTNEIGRRWRRRQLSCGLWREGVPWGLFEAKWFVNGDPFKMIGFVPRIEFPTEFFAGGGLSTDYLFEDASEFDWLPNSNSLTSTLVVVELWAQMALS
jgi:hypothetical protein